MSDHGRYSEDGRWWWNGREWLRVAGDAAPPAPPAPRAPGGTAWSSPRPGSLSPWSGAPSILRWVPGFRTGTRWKAAVASVFYFLCLLGLLGGVIGGIGARSLSPFTCMLSIPAVAVIAAHLLRYWRAAPLNAALAGGLLLSVATCGVSVATLPTQPAASRQQAASAPGTPTPTPGSPTATPASTPSPSEAASPTVSPTPTQAPVTPTPTATAAPPSDAPSTPTAAAQTPAAQAQAPAAAAPPPATCGAPANPWGYNFCGGATISNPPSNFCSYFNCIPGFWNQTNGYVMQCADGTFSHSGGVRGSCSRHGGNSRPLNRGAGAGSAKGQRA